MRLKRKILSIAANNNNVKDNVFFQPKSSLNQPYDPGSYRDEQQADAIADKVMQPSSTPQTFFQPSSIQRKEEADQTILSSKTENNISSLQGGKALSQGEKTFFESRMGYDFSNVQVHDDSNANQSAKNINALAYTHGNNIVFGSGQYQPGTDEGKKLMAHELAHVVQQGVSGNKSNKGEKIQLKPKQGKKKRSPYSESEKRTKDDICGFRGDYSLLIMLIDKYVRHKLDHMGKETNPEFEKIQIFIEDVIIFKLSEKGGQYNFCCPSNLAHFLGMIDDLPKDHWTTIQKNQKDLKLGQSIAKGEWVKEDIGPNEDYLLYEKLVKAIEKAIDDAPTMCLMETHKGYKKYGKDDSPPLVPVSNSREI